MKDEHSESAILKQLSGLYIQDIGHVQGDVYGRVYASFPDLVSRLDNSELLSLLDIASREYLKRQKDISDKWVSKNYQEEVTKEFLKLHPDYPQGDTTMATAMHDEVDKQIKLGGKLDVELMEFAWRKIKFRKQQGAYKTTGSIFGGPTSQWSWFE